MERKEEKQRNGHEAEGREENGNKDQSGSGYSIKSNTNPLISEESNQVMKGKEVEPLLKLRFGEERKILEQEKREQDELMSKLNQVMKEKEELMDQLDQLLQDKVNLAEQVLELEEAENDSRSMAQNLTIQVKSLHLQIDSLHRSLIQSNDEVENYKSQLVQLGIQIQEYQVKINQLESVRPTTKGTTRKRGG